MSPTNGYLAIESLHEQSEQKNKSKRKHRNYKNRNCSLLVISSGILSDEQTDGCNAKNLLIKSNYTGSNRISCLGLPCHDSWHETMNISIACQK